LKFGAIKKRIGYLFGKMLLCLSTPIGKRGGGAARRIPIFQGDAV
jgi:hypothetical protein